MTRKITWIGKVNETDDFGVPIRDTFYDGKTSAMGRGQGRWAIMVPASWTAHGCGRVGMGFSQKYVKQANGEWLKVEG